MPGVRNSESGAARGSRRRRRLLTTTALSLPLALASGAARADLFVHPLEPRQAPTRRFVLQPRFTYFSTDANYDELGTKSTLATGETYKRHTLDLSGGYGLTSRLTLYGRGSWALASSEVPGATATTASGSVATSATRSTYSPADQQLGASFRVTEARVDGSSAGPSLELLAQVDLPAYKNTSAAALGNPFVGDGATDFVAAAVFRAEPIPSRSVRLELNAIAGYLYRTASFSSGLPWTVQGRIASREADGFGGRLGLNGLLSLKTDPRGATTTVAGVSTTPTTSSTGTSFVNAINPSWMQAFGALEYRFSPDLALEAGGRAAIWGRNAPVGLQLALALTWTLGTAAEGDPARLSPEEYGLGNRGFVEYELEAKVTRANDRLNLIKIDKGRTHGIVPGQTFDLFSVTKAGKVESTIARGRVRESTETEATIAIEEYFQEVLIEEGFLAKRPLR